MTKKQVEKLIKKHNYEMFGAEWIETYGRNSIAQVIEKISTDLLERSIGFSLSDDKYGFKLIFKDAILSIDANGWPIAVKAVFS